MACACGQTARYAGCRPKTFLTVLGLLTLERAYYHCDACQAGVCPRDPALDLDDTSAVSCHHADGGNGGGERQLREASELLGELAGLAVDTKQVERTADALGREVADDERCRLADAGRRCAP